MRVPWREESRDWAAAWAFVAGALAGGLCMLLLDPQRGAARRAWIGQKATESARRAREEAARRVEAVKKARGAKPGDGHRLDVDDRPGSVPSLRG